MIVKSEEFWVISGEPMKQCSQLHGNGKLMSQESLFSLLFLDAQVKVVEDLQLAWSLI